MTADGTVIIPGMRIVAAPKDIAFGTVLDIDGYGTAVVRDRGGSIKGRRLDVYFSTHQAALNWGAQEIEIFKGDDE